MIHQYKLGGMNIVLDISSGSVHVVDEVAYDAIGLYETCSREEVKARIFQKYGERDDVNDVEVDELLDDIDALRNAGRLYTGDTPMADVAALKSADGVIKAMCLHVAHSCNLTCDYCFARQGSFSGERALMSFETGRQALDFLVESSEGRRNLEVDFFGGEPLLNWGVVKALVRYARSIEKQYNKKFRFTLTTNGMLIDDDVIDFCNREMHNVVLSLDGRREVHDRLRRTGDGRGSYEVIVPKFRKLVGAREGRDYYIRGTYTAHNMDFTEDIRHMLDLGFTELSMEPVVCSPDDPYAIGEDDLPLLYAQYELLAELMQEREKEGRPFTFYHYMLDLGHGPCIYKRLKGCGSGTEYLAVTPWGELYPCHQFVGDENYAMGDVWKGVTRPEIAEEFSHCNIYENPDCRDCWARLYCSGGCAANACHATGSVTGTYKLGCELFKKRIECALMVQAAGVNTE